MAAVGHGRMTLTHDSAEWRRTSSRHRCQRRSRWSPLSSASYDKFEAQVFRQAFANRKGSPPFDASQITMLWIRIRGPQWPTDSRYSTVRIAPALELLPRKHRLRLAQQPR